MQVGINICDLGIEARTIIVTKRTKERFIEKKKTFEQALKDK